MKWIKSKAQDWLGITEIRSRLINMLQSGDLHRVQTEHYFDESSKREKYSSEQEHANHGQILAALDLHWKTIGKLPEHVVAALDGAAIIDREEIYTRVDAQEAFLKDIYAEACSTHSAIESLIPKRKPVPRKKTAPKAKKRAR